MAGTFAYEIGQARDPFGPVTLASSKADPVTEAGIAVSSGPKLMVTIDSFFQETGTDPVRHTMEAMLPAVVIFWMSGVLLLSCRLLFHWKQVRRWKNKNTEPVEAVWLEKLDYWSLRLGLDRPVALVKSACVQVPASTLTGLSIAQLEAILLHELSHIKRHDYVVNLCQAVLGTVLSRLWRT